MIMLLYFSFLVDILFTYCLQLCLYVEYFSYFGWIQMINQILRECFYAEGTCSEHLVSLLSLVTLESELSLCHLWLGGTMGFPLFDLLCLNVFLSFFWAQNILQCSYIYALAALTLCLSSTCFLVPTSLSPAYLFSWPRSFPLSFLSAVSHFRLSLLSLLFSFRLSFLSPSSYSFSPLCFS